MATHPTERPLVIDAIRCRLRQDCERVRKRGCNGFTVPLDEVELIVDILDAARGCVEEWDNGSLPSMRKAEEILECAVRREI
jgi:hypothetical protein